MELLSSDVVSDTGAPSATILELLPCLPGVTRLDVLTNSLKVYGCVHRTSAAAGGCVLVPVCRASCWPFRPRRRPRHQPH